MTRDEAFRAVRVGLDLAEDWTRREGFRVVALGEMGIGNTTTAAALITALTGAPADRVVGRGTGVDDPGYLRKCRAVAAAVARHAVGIDDAWDWLARVGGFEILGLAGLAIGAARNRALVVLDGLISGAAGLIAARLCPNVLGSLVAAHLGPEPGHRVVLDDVGPAAPSGPRPPPRRGDRRGPGTPPDRLGRRHPPRHGHLRGCGGRGAPRIAVRRIRPEAAIPLNRRRP